MITFDPPLVELACTVEIALDADLSADPSTWVFEDVTEFTRFADGISVTTGRPDESSRVNPGSGGLTFANGDGRFSRHNPRGAWVGRLSPNTPIRAGVDAGEGLSYIMEQYVNEWPTRWDKRNPDCVVPITTAGIMRRLGRTKAKKSAVRRTILGATTATPLFYWPLEEGGDATSAASGLKGGRPLTSLTPPVFGSTALGAGTAGAADFTKGGTLRGDMAGPDVTPWSGSLLLLVPAVTPDVTNTSLLRVEGGSWIVEARLAAAALTVDIFLDGVLSTTLVGPGSMDDGTAHHVIVTLDQSGADVVATLTVDAVALDTDTISTATASFPRAVTFNGGGEANESGPFVSHASFYSEVFTTDLAQAALGYLLERAPARIQRLCAEESVPFAFSWLYNNFAPVDVGAQLGPQPVGKLLDVCRDAETSDGGVLHERGFGLGYQTLYERYIASPMLRLDFAQSHIAEAPEPADDDQRLVNRWTISMQGGTEATAEQETGPLGTGPSGPGVYDQSDAINVGSANQLLPQASFRVQRDTIDEDRWPSITLNFASIHARGLIPLWTALDFGARVLAINTPAQAAPGGINAIIEGVSQHVSPHDWTAVLNTTPARSYDAYRPWPDLVLGTQQFSNYWPFTFTDDFERVSAPNTWDNGWVLTLDPTYGDPFQYTPGGSFADGHVGVGARGTIIYRRGTVVGDMDTTFQVKRDDVASFAEVMFTLNEDATELIRLPSPTVFYRMWVDPFDPGTGFKGMINTPSGPAPAYSGWPDTGIASSVDTVLIRCKKDGYTCSMKIWTGTLDDEPEDWLVQQTDSDLQFSSAYLYIGFRIYPDVGQTVEIDDLSVQGALSISNIYRIAAGANGLADDYSDVATSFDVTSTRVPWIDSATYPDFFPLIITIAGEPMRVLEIVGTGLTQTFTVQRGLDGWTLPLTAGTHVQLWRPAVIGL